MRIIRFVPGAIVTPNAITLPTTAPDIDAVVTAEITRVPVGMCNLAAHGQADIIAAIDDHQQADVVDALADHGVHQHDITSVVAAGGGGALTDPLIPGPLESVGGGQVNAGAVDNIGAAQAHADGTTPPPHAAGVNPVAHGAGADPIVAAVPTRLTTRTFSLDVSTLAGDLVTLSYQEVGERVLVS